MSDALHLVIFDRPEEELAFIVRIRELGFRQ